jgi:hypothetical protein
MVFSRSSFTRLLVLLLLLGTIALHAQATPPATPQPPATILLIRHAEKPTDGNPDLSPAGVDRAKHLRELFLPAGTRSDLPMPQFLFATHISPHSNRPVQTVKNLSKALNLPINDTFKNDDYDALAAELLSGKYAGKVVLVVWHHGKIPALTTALGATPPYTPWPDQQFDRIWRIDYLNGKATVRDLPFDLMPGDSK